MKKTHPFFMVILLLATLALVIISGGCGSSGSGPSKEKADAIFFNGRIYTADAVQSEAEAMVVRAGKIVFIGKNDAAAAYDLAPGGSSLDLGGRRILPGMIDTHCHMLWFRAGTLPENQPAISPAMSKAEVLAAVKKFADANPDLPAIFGLGFDVPKCIPVHKSEIDAIVDRPVFLMDSGGHFGWANSAALKSADTKDDSASHRFERDKDGNPTGGMFEQGPVFRMMTALFPFDPKVMAEVLPEAIRQFNGFGITGIFDAGLPPQYEVAAGDALREMEANGALNLRFFTSHFAMPFEDMTKMGEKLTALGAKTDLVRPSTLKMISDGTLEASSAYMFEPYNPPGTGVGATNYTVDQMATAGKAAAKAGYGVHIHAIGDKAISQALEAFERIGPITGGKTIAHSQVLPADGIERWGKQTDVVFETTPLWLVSGFEGKEEEGYTYKVLGRERFMRQSPFQSLKKAGVVITFGSDYPVSGGIDGVYPLNEMWAAINRKTMGGNGIYSPASEYLDVKDAIDACTINAARQLKAEKEIGSLEVGKSADFIVLDKDILTINPLDIHGIVEELGFKDGVSVVKTYLRGKLVYEKK